MNAASKTTVRHTAASRGTARLVAVQALYEMDVAGAATEAVLAGFVDDRWTSDGGSPPPAALVEPDRALLAELVRGVATRLDELDPKIEAALSGKWTVARLETVLRAILRAGAFELLARPETPPRVIINEYVEVAHAFFAGGEPGLVNGVLDSLARAFRPGELEAGKDDPTAGIG